MLELKKQLEEVQKIAKELTGVKNSKMYDIQYVLKAKELLKKVEKLQKELEK
ncbi:MAG: hypothetical protein ACRCZO_15305 [Cetobacterium sp.]